MSTSLPASHRIGRHEGFSLAMASTAPWYSILVTAPLMAALVGAGTPLAYLLGAVPAWLVALGMNANDRRQPDKGTVYTWLRGRFPRLGWFAGFCLAATGVIATSGLAYVAATLTLPGAALGVHLAVGAVLMGVAAWLNIVSLRVMTLLQSLSGIVAVLAAGLAVWLLVSGQLTLLALGGAPIDWFRAVLLAVFAYWGFDAIFALTDHTPRGEPQRVALGVVAGLVALFMIGGLAVSTANAELLLEHPLTRLAVVLSAVMSLGSTLIPTARGMEAMAEAGELPAARTISAWRGATLGATVLAVVWLGWLLVSPGLFDDTIEALSVFVGLYFIGSSLIAFLNADAPEQRWVHGLAVGLMAVVTLAVAAHMFSPDYGSTQWAGVGGVGLIVLVVLACGAIGSFVWTRQAARRSAERR